MRIAFVMPWHIHQGRGGGAELQAWYFACEMARRSISVSYICQSANEKRGREMVDGVEVWWLKPSGKFQWMDLNKYYKTLCLVQPDIVIQRMSAASSWPIACYCRDHRKTFVWICADDDAPFAWMHIRKYLRYQKIRSFKALLFLGNALMNDLCRRKAMPWVNVAFTQHASQAENLLRQFGLKSERITSGHPRPLERIAPRQLFANRTLIWIANLSPRKRPELFVELARRLASKGYRCQMIGSRDDSEYRNTLLKNVPGNLEILGKLSPDEVNRRLSQASVLVNTSDTGGEGFPNTFVQAWLRGVPVVTLGINPDQLIEAKELGAVCSDLDEAVNQLEYLLNNEHSYIRTSDRCFQFAVENHTLQRVVKNFTNCFVPEPPGIPVEVPE